MILFFLQENGRETREWIARSWKMFKSYDKQTSPLLVRVRYPVGDPNGKKDFSINFSSFSQHSKIRLRILKIKQNLLKLEDFSEGFENLLSVVGVGSTCGGQILSLLEMLSPSSKRSPRTIHRRKSVSVHWCEVKYGTRLDERRDGRSEEYDTRYENRK